MKKTNINCLPVILLILLISSFNAAAQCKAKQIAKGCKANMAPYKYDSYAINEITFTDKPQKVEVEFTAFSGQKYKLVFCTSGFEEAVTLNVYDKNSKAKKRNKVFDTSQGIDNNFWAFEPAKPGVYFIEYDVPPAISGVTGKIGCVVMMVGYK